MPLGLEAAPGLGECSAPSGGPRGHGLPGWGAGRGWPVPWETPLCELLEPLGQRLLVQAGLRLLHPALAGENEEGRGVALVGEPHDPAGEAPVQEVVKLVLAPHHGHLHHCLRAHVEVLLAGALGVEASLPLS